MVYSLSWKFAYAVFHFFKLKMQGLVKVYWNSTVSPASYCKGLVLKRSADHTDRHFSLTLPLSCHILMCWVILSYLWLYAATGLSLVYTSLSGEVRWHAAALFVAQRLADRHVTIHGVEPISELSVECSGEHMSVIGLPNIRSFHQNGALLPM